MKIHRSLNPVAGENTYYLEGERHLLLVDPGSDWPTIEKKIKELGKPILAILLTHTHYDHILSLDLVREAFGHPPVYVAQSEADWLYRPQANGSARHPELGDLILQPAQHIFQYQEPYHLEEFHFSVRETPGHSIGGVSFVFPESELVLTGDALFRETIGRTDLPTGNLDQLLQSIRSQLFTLPNHYRIYPGHGWDSTIGHEKTYNPFFQ